jgi:hypothetical protein
MKIKLIPVNSSNVAAVGYDEASKTLAVQFHNHGRGNEIYHYTGVPKSTFEALRDAESVGKYLNAVIKTQYEYTKVTT